MSNPFAGPDGVFQVKSPFRLPWYKDKSYVILSVLSVVTISALTWITVKQEIYGKDIHDWAGTGPKPRKRTESHISSFKKALEQRDAEEKKSNARKAVEKKRMAKFEAEGHRYEE